MGLQYSGCLGNRHQDKCKIIDDLNSNKEANCLSITHCNIHSLPAHCEELETCYSQWNESENPLVIGLCKTWLSPSNEFLYTPYGYKCIHRSRSSRTGGGVLLWVPDSVVCQPQNDLTDCYASFTEAATIHKCSGQRIAFPEISADTFLDDLARFLEKVFRCNSKFAGI